MPVRMTSARQKGASRTASPGFSDWATRSAPGGLFLIVHGYRCRDKFLAGSGCTDGRGAPDALRTELLLGVNPVGGLPPPTPRMDTPYWQAAMDPHGNWQAAPP